MQQIARRIVWLYAAGLLAAAAVALPPPGPGTSYAERIRTLSEPGGAFDTDNLISNEASYLDVLPDLVEGGVTGGAYVGVGPDQNFSYIARIRPAVAYIIDVRRDNLLLHLLFKALFAEAPTRLEYLSLLTGRAPPDPTGARPEAPLDELVERVERAERRTRGDLQRDIEARIRTFGVPLTSRDFETIARFHSAFIGDGFNLRFQSYGRRPRPEYPTLRELLLKTDQKGRQGSYLATEEAYRFVRELQAKDAVIPVVGNVSGPHAMRAIAAALAADDLALSAFYVSNVEDYLFRSSSFGPFVENVDRLPRTSRSVLIRSVFRGGPSLSVVQRVDDLVAGAARGDYPVYRDLIYGDRRWPPGSPALRR